jgi:hypothetical protein
MWWNAMSILLRMIFGSAMGTWGVEILGDGWVVSVLALLGSLLFHMILTQLLNALMDGMDPMVRYRSKNLKELATYIHIPLPLTLINFMGKALLFSVVTGVVYGLGWSPMGSAQP